LEIILKKDLKNISALRELGYWYIRQGDTNSALKQFSEAYQYHPEDPQITFELAKLFILTKQYANAKNLLNAIKTDDLALKQQIKIASNQIPTAELLAQENLEKNTSSHLQIKNNNSHNSRLVPMTQIPEKQLETKLATIETTTQTPVSTSDNHDTLFNRYYSLKKNHPQQAWKILQKILQKYPNDVNALKEAGYTTLNAKDKKNAYLYFKRAYDITQDPDLAMQLGYISVDLNQKKLAYHYFDLASDTKNEKNKVSAEISKTYLTGNLMKILPEPYYADIYYDPFYFSRFKMVVQPLVIKAGKVINEKYQFKIYLSYQRTTDNRSTVADQLPQIYDDNASITALGAQINPILDAPLTAFVEAGKAIDIVYQNRSRWRNDLRGGLAYYKNWGVEPTYDIHPVFSDHVIGDLYSDMIYFSRYRDIIGSVRLREGIRLFKYETSSIDVYMKGFLVWDTAHQYYNNIIEWGPGIAFTPSNRYNIVFHLEALQGHYIPAGTSPSPNPYNSNYHNNLVLLDCFFRI